jgi:hypothetical protein
VTRPAAPRSRTAVQAPRQQQYGSEVQTQLRRLPDGLVARRVWPAGDGLVVEARCDAVPGLVGVHITPDAVRVHAGRDPKLPALAAELARPETVLLGHRPGRRAVLRRGSGGAVSYVKVVRPGRTGPAVAGLAAGASLRAGCDLVAVPDLLDADDAAGVLRIAEVPGPTLHELLVAGSARAVVTAARTGFLLDAVAVTPAPAAGLPHHDHDAEAGVLRRWIGMAARWTALDLAAPGTALAAALRALPQRPPVVCHRDLHDKQVVAAGARIGLLDLDTLCLADPALDRANLLAHLRLRVLQGRWPAPLAAACAQRLGPLDAAAGEDPALAVYTSAALLRLAAVYAVRPGPPDLPARLAAEATSLPASPTAFRRTP